MRVIKKCRILLGYQAALTTRTPIELVLNNGIIINPKNEKWLNKWVVEYTDLLRYPSLRWKKQDWWERGYILVKKQSAGSFRHYNSQILRTIPVKIREERTWK